MLRRATATYSGTGHQSVCRRGEGQPCDTLSSGLHFGSFPRKTAERLDGLMDACLDVHRAVSSPMQGCELRR